MLARIALVLLLALLPAALCGCPPHMSPRFAATVGG